MKKLLGRIIISVAAIIVGYWAMVLPFHLFDTLSGIQMRILFISEILIYFAIFSAFFIIKEAKTERKKKEEEYKNRHRKRVSKRLNELDGIKIYSSYDPAA